MESSASSSASSAALALSAAKARANGRRKVSSRFSFWKHAKDNTAMWNKCVEKAADVEVVLEIIASRGAWIKHTNGEQNYSRQCARCAKEVAIAFGGQDGDVAQAAITKFHNCVMQHIFPYAQLLQRSWAQEGAAQPTEKELNLCLAVLRVGRAQQRGEAEKRMERQITNATRRDAPQQVLARAVAVVEEVTESDGHPTKRAARELFESPAVARKHARLAGSSLGQLIGELYDTASQIKVLFEAQQRRNREEEDEAAASGGSASTGPDPVKAQEKYHALLKLAQSYRDRGNTAMAEKFTAAADKAADSCLDM